MEFYPSCIEKGMRSERALKLAIAEMYVKRSKYPQGLGYRPKFFVAPKSARPRSAGWQRSSMKRLRLGRRSLSDRFNTWYLMRPMNRFASVPMWSSRRF
uniref:Transposase n=1 Tax=Salmonella typhimurium TaxID=90371 RepID=A0A0P0IPN4_SALTM|nr:transposase [Salmonella enterica subsp. enterica serovar Typhimurium]